MKIYDNLRVAMQMGVPREYAISCRQRYLFAELLRSEAEMAETKGLVFALGTVYEGQQYISQLREELEALKRVGAPKEDNMVTKEMKEQARTFPIDRLISFNRAKKATAWCHDDRNPSLCLMTKTNTAWCPVCNKYFDPIAVAMSRDGMTFTEAVRHLL